jgi:hypothetical protein
MAERFVTFDDLQPGPRPRVELRIWYATCTEVTVPPDASRKLGLSYEESSLLNRVLGTYLGDLRMEISGTDNPRMRRELREEEKLLRSLRSRLDDLDSMVERAS